MLKTHLRGVKFSSLSIRTPHKLPTPKNSCIIPCVVVICTGAVSAGVVVFCAIVVVASTAIVVVSAGIAVGSSAITVVDEPSVTVC